MITAIVLVSLVAYIVICAAVWERKKLTPLECAADHGSPYDYIRSCNKHTRWQSECPQCALKSHRNCAHCNVKLLWIAIWPICTPIWIGQKIGRKESIHGIRFRKAERVAKHIANMESDIWSKEET